MTKNFCANINSNNNKKITKVTPQDRKTLTSSTPHSLFFPCKEGVIDCFNGTSTTFNFYQP